MVSNSAMEALNGLLIGFSITLMKSRTSQLQRSKQTQLVLVRTFSYSRNTSGPILGFLNACMDFAHADYELVGFVSHVGKNTFSGHYVCHVKKVRVLVSNLVHV